MALNKVTVPENLELTRSTARGSASPGRAPLPFNSNSQWSFVGRLGIMGREQERGAGTRREEGERRRGFARGGCAFKEPMTERTRKRVGRWNLTRLIHGTATAKRQGELAVHTLLLPARLLF
ncbi:hypothetical protein BHM03_00025713 [Ensete ventricosum]|nr:hypothetical protein BHM03_00025713 [Ensete ventricosum]